MFELEPFVAARADAEPLAALWNAACQPSLAITPDVVRANTLPIPDVVHGGCLARQHGTIVGWVQTSRAAIFGNGGWIDCLVVDPAARQQGVGTALLDWAEQWLAAQGVSFVRLGGSLIPFAPGLPTTLGMEPFFIRHGFRQTAIMWDLACDLRDYQPLTTPQSVMVQPVAAGEEGRLLAFLDRAFPGRWAWECREFLRRGGRSSDYLVGRVEDVIVGFAQTTSAASVRPLGRFFHTPLPTPWGQIGPIGVDAEQRGRGFGSQIIDAAVRHMQASGVAGCIIDWTDRLALYARFGFQPHRSYAMLSKGLSHDA